MAPRKSQQSLKGKYTLLHPEKYTGNPTSIIFRSMWERKFMLYCDKTPEVLEWSSDKQLVSTSTKAMQWKIAIGQTENLYHDNQ